MNEKEKVKKWVSLKYCEIKHDTILYILPPFQYRWCFRKSILFQFTWSFEVLRLTLTLLETVQPIRFYRLFYNWLNDLKTIFLKMLFDLNLTFFNLCALRQNIKYYETKEYIFPLKVRNTFSFFVVEEEIHWALSFPPYMYIFLTIKLG